MNKPTSLSETHKIHPNKWFIMFFHKLHCSTFNSYVTQQKTDRNYPFPSKFCIMLKVVKLMSVKKRSLHSSFQELPVSDFVNIFIAKT